ncbi:hypothetical protein GGR54DRAFT_638707 [Hypoxylon sp. NC1633]|nr:hypothetical protein GGR54DRAFT_638707 [Hypoxylon sp. NC1633]
MQRYEGVWRKRNLLPCWILQMLCGTIYAVIAAVLLAAAANVQRHEDDPQFYSTQYDYYGYSASQLVEYAQITGAVVLVLGIGTLILDSVEITLFARRRLSPVLLLSTACIKTLVWGVYFILTICAAATGSISAADLILGLILVLTSSEQLVLGAIYTHRKRKGLLSNSGSTKRAEFEEDYEMGYRGAT